MRVDLLSCIGRLSEEGRPYALATVIETVGSSSAKTGAKAVIDERGRVVCGWVGGGCAEAMVREAAVEALSSGATKIIEIDLNEELFGAGMPCGGAMRVFIEPVAPRQTLWITGHGRIAESLCLLASLMGLKVIVHSLQAEPDKFPGAERMITDDPGDYRELQPKPEDFVVIATQHKGDIAALSRALSAQTVYIALIASRKRAALVMQRLREEGASEAELNRIRAPAGLDIGARTPEEVALAIMAEITAVRRKGDGGKLSMSGT